MVADLPPPPRNWLNEKAIADYINAVLDIGEYREVKLFAMKVDLKEVKRILQPLPAEDWEEWQRSAMADYRAGNRNPLHDIFLYSKHALSQEAKELIVAQADRKLNSLRSAGRPKKQPEDTEASRVLIPAEDLFYLIYGLLRSIFPRAKVEGKHIRNRALALAVRRINSQLGPNTVRFETLDWFNGLGPSDPKRLGQPKLKLKHHCVTITQYLNIG
jgi:hypothetical protein